MSATDDARRVARNIDVIYAAKIAAAVATSMRYAALSLQYFRREQQRERFWKNRTNIAKDTVFAEGVETNDFIGFYIAHLVQYGVYLEKANNRKNEALRPVLQRFAGRYLRDIQAIFG